MAEEIKIAYLLDPFYQVQDNNGLTVAGAQIFVYQAGTSNPANTFKNFNGALNTWPVLTDTLGNATVLADISKTYDVLIKDQNGNLLMSKQNIVPGGAGEGGGSITPVEPIDQQHWIGLNGSSTAVSADLVGTILHLPDASDEYQAFIESNRNDHIILSDGLYLVHAVIDIKQDSDALENTIENLTVMTGVDDPEDVIFERDEAGHDASDNVHSLKLSFIRHAEALEGTNELFFRIISAVNLTSAAIRRLSIVKLQTSGYGSDSPSEYTAGDGISITSGAIGVKYDDRYLSINESGELSLCGNFASFYTSEASISWNYQQSRGKAVGTFKTGRVSHIPVGTIINFWLNGVFMKMTSTTEPFMADFPFMVDVSFQGGKARGAFVAYEYDSVIVPGEGPQYALNGSVIVTSEISQLNTIEIGLADPNLKFSYEDNIIRTARFSYVIPMTVGPYNPLGLPPYTIRCKFSSGYTPTMGDSQTLVNAEENVWDITKNSKSWESLFDGNRNIISVLGANSRGVLTMALMFFDCRSLTSVAIFDTRSCTDMTQMFYICTSLTTIPLFDTSSCRSMRSMFYNCRNVQSGALALYQKASTQSTVPSHTFIFENCGIDTTTGLAELQQIPQSWGGLAPG